jgi:hypothetical protein
MIDRCDPEIATWSDTGDNFVVKNVEKFSSSVLPQVRLSEYIQVSMFEWTKTQRLVFLFILVF